MPNPDDVASNQMLWERVLSLLIVSASALGGSAVLLIQALPQILQGFYIEAVSSGTHASSAANKWPIKRLTKRPTRKLTGKPKQLRLLEKIEQRI